MMDLSLIEWVAIVYVSLNAAITLFVSILGVKYVRDEIKRRKNMMQSPRAQPNIVMSAGSSANIDDPIASTWPTDEPNEMNRAVQVLEMTTSVERTNNRGIQKDDEELKDRLEAMSKMKFLKMWLKLVWKMRNCYLSLFVHLFDVLTDMLVLIEWWSLEDSQEIAHVDSRLMAQCGIIVLIVHKVMSTLAFAIKDKSIHRSIFQFLDILIFEEILLIHGKIVSEFRGHADVRRATETTTSFKYIRSLGAVWESIPQSMLQMIFLIRTNGEYEGNDLLLVISILSIFQSIISMTNSILKQDNLYMDYPKFKKHRKRLPPTFQFFKHALCRFAEVFYRIALLSLLWAVCGGEMFSVMVGVEISFIIGLTLLDRFSTNRQTLKSFNAEEIFMRIQCLVLLNPEMIYGTLGDTYFVNMGVGYSGYRRDNGKGCDLFDCCKTFRKTVCGKTESLWQSILYWILWGCCTTIFCCYIPSSLLTTCCCCYGISRHFVGPRFRIGISMMEWIFIIVGGVYLDEYGYIYEKTYGFTVFVAGLILFMVYTQFLYLMPSFEMPHGVSIRSKWGYAFNGELDELKRLRELELVRIKKDVERKVLEGKIADSEVSRIENIVPAQRDYWDQKVRIRETSILYGKGLTGMPGTSPAMFALANGHMEIVEWLEMTVDARLHRELLMEDQQINVLNESFARRYIDPDGEFFKLKTRGNN